MGRIHSRGLCPPCRARHRLDELFATASDQLAVEHGPLREHLASYPNPYGLIGYLTGTGGRLIHRLLTGELRAPTTTSTNSARPAPSHAFAARSSRPDSCRPARRT
jgi:hypothetical protein